MKLSICLESIRDLPFLLLRFVKSRGHLILSGPATHKSGRRQQVARHDIQPGAFLTVYWKSLPIGCGPGVSLYIHDYEILRCDCFGGRDGHIHTNLRDLTGIQAGSGDHLLFAETSIQDQMDRSLFELRFNSHFHLRRNWNRSVQKFRLDPDRLEAAVSEAQERMRALHMENA